MKKYRKPLSIIFNVNSLLETIKDCGCDRSDDNPYRE